MAGSFVVLSVVEPYTIAEPLLIEIWIDSSPVIGPPVNDATSVWTK